MKLTLMRVLHTTPGLRSVMRHIHPFWSFRLTRYSVTVASWLVPHTRKLAEPFRQVIGRYFDANELNMRARRYLLYLRLFKDTECAWSNWEHRADWLAIKGEEHLAEALKAGKGALLLSCHNFGLSKLVAPALARQGYAVCRAGNGKKSGRRVARWGKNYRIGWQYLDHQGGYWHRLKTLKRIREALAANQVVHISPRAYIEGEEDMAVEFFERRYFLDARWFRLFQLCEAPALPCFAIAEDGGAVKILIHRPLPAEAKLMAREFARIEGDYLTRFPEFGRLWKAVYLNRSMW